jgi:hypothetical protein
LFTMSNSIQCPQCFRTIRFTDQHAGKTVSCPGCQARVQLTASADVHDVLEPVDDAEMEPDGFDGGIDESDAVARAPAPRPVRGKRKSASRPSKKSQPAPAGLRNPVVIGVIAAAVVGSGLLVVVVVVAFMYFRGGDAGNPPPLADQRNAETRPDGSGTVAAVPAPAPQVHRAAPPAAGNAPPPTVSTPPQQTPPAVADGPARIRLPGQATTMVVGGGGQYLVFRMADETIHVFDLARREFAGQIPVPRGGRVTLAASRRHLFLIDSASARVQRVDLPSGSNEYRVEHSTLASIDSPAIGADSDGPLVVRVRVGGIAQERKSYEWSVIDPDTLLANPIRLTGASDFVDDEASPPHVCASPDGRIICMWRTSGSPTGLQIFHLAEDFRSAVVRYEHESVRYAQPDRSGQLVYASNAVYDGALVRLDTVNDSIPVGVAQLYLKRLSRSSQRDVWALCRPGVAAPLVELPNLTISRLDEPSDRQGGLRGDKRMRVFLQYQCVVAVSPSRDELAIYPFNLPDALARADTKLIVPLSAPPTETRPGDVLTYKVDAVGREELTFALDYGPPGMTLTPQGELSWPVPDDFSDTEASVIIAIDTPSGTRDYQSFVVAVRRNGQKPGRPGG